MGMTVRQTTGFPEDPNTKFEISMRRPARATLKLRRPAWCPDMRVRVNGRRWAAASDAAGYVNVARQWRTGDTVDVALPMTTRREPLPGAPEYVAFVRGPIVLAGRLGREGLAPGNQIIVNERQSGTMLNVPMDVPVLGRDGRPAGVDLAPYYTLAHERYNLYWKVPPAERQ
jgi:hypothetical protein